MRVAVHSRCFGGVLVNHRCFQLNAKKKQKNTTKVVIISDGDENKAYYYKSIFEIIFKLREYCFENNAIDI